MRGLEMTRRLFEITDEHDLDYMEYLEVLFQSDEYLGIYLHEVRHVVIKSAHTLTELVAGRLSARHHVPSRRRATGRMAPKVHEPRGHRLLCPVRRFHYYALGR